MTYSCRTCGRAVVADPATGLPLRCAGCGSTMPLPYRDPVTLTLPPARRRAAPGVSAPTPSPLFALPPIPPPAPRPAPTDEVPHLQLAATAAWLKAAGAGLVVAGAALAARSAVLLTTGGFADGCVTATATQRTAGGDLRAVSTVRYTAADGRSYEIAGGDHPAGACVPVAYPKDAPGDGRVRGFGPLWGLPLACSLFGGGLIALAAVAGREAAAPGKPAG